MIEQAIKTYCAFNATLLGFTQVVSLRFCRVKRELALSLLTSRGRLIRYKKKSDCMKVYEKMTRPLTCFIPLVHMVHLSL